MAGPVEEEGHKDAGVRLSSRGDGGTVSNVVRRYSKSCGDCLATPGTSRWKL